MRVVTLHLTLDSGESASNRHWTVVNLRLRERTVAHLLFGVFIYTKVQSVKQVKWLYFFL